MEDLLIKAGLNEVQSKTYLYLLEHGRHTPPALAHALRITRSNAYKVLEQLEEMSLVQKLEAEKKLAYQAADPTALASLVAEERNRVILLEHTVNDAMQRLRAKYRKGVQTNEITIDQGKASLVEAYEHQAELQQPIYFVRSRADIPLVGFETMDRLRRLPAKSGTKRFGIVPDSAEAPTDPTIDAQSNLTRTWVPAEHYTAPVEWSVSGGELLITVFEDDGYYIRIKNPSVAQAFEQLWKLTDSQIRRRGGGAGAGPKSKRTL